MLPLAELQRHFSRAVMTGEIRDGLLSGRVPPAEALAVHQGTIMGALVNALRISYSTVEALVGEEFFDQTCRAFAVGNLPRTASLAAYGEGFPDFLAHYHPAASLPYLADVARLDHAMEATLRGSSRLQRFVLDAQVAITLPQSMTVLRLAYPADEIRAALDDDAALAAIATTSAERFILVWRKGSEAAVKRIEGPAGQFLASLLAGEGAEAAFQAAICEAPEMEALRVIQAETFAASFCTVISTIEETP